LATPSDLYGNSNWRLTLMRNEIYARHGRIFASEDIQSYFSQQSWYAQDSGFSETRLSETERKNAVIIREYQEQEFEKPATHP
jgi:hypothetical protein